MKILFTIIVLIGCSFFQVVYGQSEESFTNVEKMPEFPGGPEAMYKYLFSNLSYPPLAKAKGISGNVIVQYVVQANGEITDAKVVRGIGHGCDEEAMRVILSMNENHRWTPGSHNGRPVPVTFTLPIKFYLK